MDSEQKDATLRKQSPMTDDGNPRQEC